MFPMPATIVYARPTERVIFWPERDANPFFHFMECLWMINGRNDVAWIDTYSGGIKRYSDNGLTFHGAYGHRWRRHFQMDQLMMAVEELKRDHNNRRVYIAMWDPEHDLAKDGKDFPCNVGLTFQVNFLGALDMVVHNRSNDLVWGALGANAVHFSFLQEVVAAMVGVPVGGYWQVSSNLHAYHDTYKKVEELRMESPDPYSTTRPWDPYELKEVEPFPIMSVAPDVWFQDLGIFMKEGPIVGFRDPFFRQVVTPMYMAHKAYRDRTNPNRYHQAIEILTTQCRASDWRKAGVEWLERRLAAWLESDKELL